MYIFLAPHSSFIYAGLKLEMCEMGMPNGCVQVFCLGCKVGFGVVCLVLGSEWCVVSIWWEGGSGL